MIITSQKNDAARQVTTTVVEVASAPFGSVGATLPAGSDGFVGVALTDDAGYKGRHFNMKLTVVEAETLRDALQKGLTLLEDMKKGR